MDFASISFLRLISPFHPATPPSNTPIYGNLKFSLKKTKYYYRLYLLKAYMSRNINFSYPHITYSQLINYVDNFVDINCLF